MTIVQHYRRLIGTGLEVTTNTLRRVSGPVCLIQALRLVDEQMRAAQAWSVAPSIHLSCPRRAPVSTMS